MKRRDFLIGCSGAIAALAGSRLTGLSFGAPSVNANECLVVIFLRGGWDALSVLSPLEDTERKRYLAARPQLAVPTNLTLSLGNGWGLHKALEPLWELYQQGSMAVMAGTGMPFDSRSHFDAMTSMELGLPGKTIGKSGWLARAIASAPNPSVRVQLSANLAAGNNMPGSLRGDLSAVAIPKLEDFRLSDDADYRKELSRNLERIYKGDSMLHRAGSNTLNALQLAASITPTKTSDGYPDSEFAKNLATVATVLRAGLGLRSASVDLGGWDTHEYQGEHGKGYFAEHLEELALGLKAFYADLERSNLNKNVTTIVVSEFGRRVQENASQGTDHGHGSAMLVLGGSINGKKVYGNPPSLHPDALYDRADLGFSLDYRDIIAEILETRFKHQKMNEVFPDFKRGSKLNLLRA
jgi:uncharacterized protein (DUF1501 family)